MTTMRMIVDDCVDSLTVFCGIINRIADKLQQLTDKSQGVYFFGHGVQLHSVCVQYRTVGLNEKSRIACAGAQVKLV